MQQMPMMDSPSGGAMSLFFLLFLFLFWLTTIVIAILALLSLRRRPIDELPRVFWAALILLIPIAGPIAFFIVSPGRQNTPGTM